jgi:hypothetical protein
VSKRTANLIVISSDAEASPAVHYAPQRISELTNSSNAHVHAIFAEAAFLAGKAIEAATELQRMPGMSAEAFADTLDFWRRMRDHAGTAALDSLGENTTLAEALVTFRLLHNPSNESTPRDFRNRFRAVGSITLVR